MSLRLSASWLVVSFILSGCAALQTQDPYTGETKTSNTAKGAGAGALGGAVLGAIIGHGNRAQGALIGAGIGGLAGAGVGAYMDSQETELRRELESTGVRVARDGDKIKLVMPGNITFKTDSADINAQFYPVLDSVAKVIKKYDETAVSIVGHTDSTGSMQHNLALSMDRAQSVAHYLESRQVNPVRVQTLGQGPNYPVASNATPAGREQNRRVEITLIPTKAS